MAGLRLLNRWDSRYHEIFTRRGRYDVSPEYGIVSDLDAAYYTRIDFDDIKYAVPGMYIILDAQDSPTRIAISSNVSDLMSKLELWPNEKSLYIYIYYGTPGRHKTWEEMYGNWHRDLGEAKQTLKRMLSKYRTDRVYRQKIY